MEYSAVWEDGILRTLSVFLILQIEVSGYSGIQHSLLAIKKWHHLNVVLLSHHLYRSFVISVWREFGFFTQGSISQKCSYLSHERPLSCLLQIALRSWQQWVMPRKSKDHPHTFSSSCTVRKQAKLPSLRADSQISFQISCPLLSFLDALTMPETCFFFISLPLLEKHEVGVVGWWLRDLSIILETKVKLNMLFQSLR